MLFSEEEELRMGKEWYPSIMWGGEGGGGEYRDEKLRSYLNDIVQALQGASHRPHIKVEFAIQNSSVPNAWAIPGYVSMTRGLLAGLESEAEFAYVMGHEIGHVAVRHSASQLSKGIFMSFILQGASLAMGSSPYSDAALALGSIGGNLLMLKYSRDDELVADRLGVEYMAKVGYLPKNAINAHKNLERASQEYLKAVGKNSEEGGFFTDLLSTHPRTSVRIDELEKIIRDTSVNAIRGDGTNRLAFLNATAELRKTHRLYVDYYDKAVKNLKENKIDEAKHLILEAIKEKKDEAPFQALYGFILVRKDNLNEAEVYFNNALKLHAQYQPAYRGLGIIYYKKNDNQKSIAYLKKAIQLFPDDMPSFYFMGMNYYKMNMHHEAIKYLKSFSEVYPKHPTVHGTLGTCYEKTNNLKAAYEEYTMQIKVAPDNEMGRYARTRLNILRNYFIK
ncbi:MAG TPA: M48 family metalloprotease [Syntrophorhabdaceae bacterium]|nr:M48 family metalloprotease [Syntrophorhabdaceae bacterium]HQE79912.1 M48 family metalloprotease [Syntrophorhabdaceae bacterium]HQK45659.1 M48 family metalloprotease [Syntrophorhabdaceae bacterium]HRR71198.1 M48 family metalloprotease [Syntrophorhabdaceae bacterium]HRV22089.1 M48 family metalloprotease [Syntrophorhabdaceae bacterium]